MKILLNESFFTQNQPISFEVSSEGTERLVNFVLINPSGAIIAEQSRLPEEGIIQFNYDPAKHLKGRIKLGLDFSAPEGGHYDVTVFSGRARRKVGQFQIVQPTNKHYATMVFGLEGDDDTDAP